MKLETIAELDRRSFLRAGMLGAFGMSLPQLLRGLRVWKAAP